jgi:tetratricopeptide (TPR) repeat protein
LQACAKAFQFALALGACAGLVNWLEICPRGLAQSILFERADCVNLQIHPDRRIVSCTRIIESAAVVDRHTLAVAHHGRAVAYVHKHDFARALADFDDAVRLEPNNSGNHQNRGNLYDLMGDYDKAIADYNESIRLGPRPSVYFDRGLARERHGDLEGAIADYLESARLNPTFMGPQQRLAALKRSGVTITPRQSDRAAAPITPLPPSAAGDRFPGNAAQLTQAAAALHQQGRDLEAEPLAKRALDLAEKTFGPDHPEIVNALSNLGEVLRAQRRYAEAHAVFERALTMAEKTLGPDNPRVAAASIDFGAA